MRLLLTLFFTAITIGIFAQRKTKAPQPTPAEERMANYEKRNALTNSSIANGLRFESIGPSIMSGRVVDIAVNPKRTTEFYVAYASGGLWHTDNNGTTFESVFDSEITLTIGAIAVDWNSGHIWIGSGEVNSSRSSYAGTGMYHSPDRGQNWDFKGLAETHHIGRVIIHPKNPDIVWVAALGHLYSPNKERGVFKTEDGGATWTKTLFVNGNTGAVDMEIDDSNPDHLFVSMWNRERRAWNFVEGGPGSGVFESSNGGDLWTKISTADLGFPQGDNIGRIGIDFADIEGDWVIYAMVDNQNEREEQDEAGDDELSKNDFKNMSVAEFDGVSNADLQEYLESNGFASEYDSTAVRDMVSKGKIEPRALYEYLTDANADLFDKPIVGGEVYRYSKSSGKWNRTHEDYIDDVVFTYGYYFGLIECHPNRPSDVYIAGVPILKSSDSGANWEGINADNMHVDHHVIWLDPKIEGHMIIGNDGGINITYDGGESYIKCNNPPVGQFYTVNVDYAQNYNVYGGLQDNGVWKGPNDYQAGPGWHQEGKYPYEMLMGGDGMQVEIDMRDNETVYTGYQFGHYYRLQGRSRHYFHPKHELGERPLRWNWQTPIHLSHHNQDILYMGSNRFHRSMDQGDNWETLSGDLTQGGKPGDVPFGTLTMIHESPLQFGLIYVGSDDGRIHRSADVGNSWTEITGKLPKDLWVTRVIASSHQKDRVYATLNGYRSDHFDAYVYVSEDQGENWTRLGLNLPKEPVNVIKEDPVNQDLLYVGTDNGLYISLDRGKNFMTIDSELPPVAIHDLVIQEETRDLVIGTHGRSLYKLNINQLQDWSSDSELEIFDLGNVYASDSWGGSGWSVWFGYDEPSIDLPMYSKDAGMIDLRLESDSGLVLTTWKDTLLFKGFNTLEYDLTYDKSQMSALEKELNAGLKDEIDPIELEEADNGKTYLPIGSYRLIASMNGMEAEKTLVVE